MTENTEDQAKVLAELILSMDLVTAAGATAKHIALGILGRRVFEAHAHPITTNGTTRWIDPGEPLFLIRGRDVVSGDAVRAWANLAEKQGADPGILEAARKQAVLMDEWTPKKVPDLPTD